VQRCPSNPQEKRCTGTGEETKIPKFKKRKIKELKEFKELKENGREENNQINAKKQIKLKGKFPGIKKGTSSLTSSQKKSATVALAI